MKQLKYNASDNLLRIEFPVEWDGKLVSGLTLGVTKTDGTVLLAPTAATLYASTTLDEAAARYASEIVLVSGAAAVDAGDPLLVAGVAGDEVRLVKAYDTATRTVIIESFLDNSHDAGEAVYGLFGTYTLDTTDTDAFTLALPVVLTWTPAGSGDAITEMARISKSALDLAGLERRFKYRYPRAYDAFRKPSDKFNLMASDAEFEVEQDLLIEQLDIQRIVDQQVMLPAIMAKMAWLWVLNADDDMEKEREVIAAEYDNKLNVIKGLPIWADDTQDGIKDDFEEMDHSHIFERGW